MSKNGIDIQAKSYHVDFSNLCGGNDYAALTNGYDRNAIKSLVWSVTNSNDRIFLTKAISIQQMLDKCPSDDDEHYMSLMEKQVELQYDYERSKTSTTQSFAKEKAKGYNTTESAVLMYFLHGSSVNTTNQGEKNCLQKDAQNAYSKTFGWSAKSYEGRINLDFLDPAVRTAMEKIANDYKNVNPTMVKEIWRVYNDYEDDFYEKYREKLKKIL